MSWRWQHTYQVYLTALQSHRNLFPFSIFRSQFHCLSFLRIVRVLSFLDFVTALFPFLSLRLTLILNHFQFLYQFHRLIFIYLFNCQAHLRASNSENSWFLLRWISVPCRPPVIRARSFSSVWRIDCVITYIVMHQWQPACFICLYCFLLKILHLFDDNHFNLQSNSNPTPTGHMANFEKI